MQEVETKDLIRSWIAKKNGKLEESSISDDTPILEQRIVSSLHVMELVLFLEKLRKKPVDTRHVKPEVFHSINTLYESFFREQPLCQPTT